MESGHSERCMYRTRARMARQANSSPLGSLHSFEKLPNECFDALLHGVIRRLLVDRD